MRDGHDKISQDAMGNVLRKSHGYAFFLIERRLCGSVEVHGALYCLHQQRHQPDHVRRLQREFPARVSGRLQVPTLEQEK